MDQREIYHVFEEEHVHDNIGNTDEREGGNTPVVFNKCNNIKISFCKRYLALIEVIILKINMKIILTMDMILTGQVMIDCSMLVLEYFRDIVE